MEDGGGFSRGGRGEFGAWLVSPSAVPCVSEEASEARSVSVSRVQDRTCVGCNATATGVL